MSASHLPENHGLLSHQELLPTSTAQPTRWVYLLHGILGQGNNLRSLARAWLEGSEDLGAILVDLRNHGRSQDLPGADDLAQCAADLHALITQLGRPPAALLGHSFGGKVSMQYAMDCRARGQQLPQLWVLDSQPGTLAESEIDRRPGSTYAVMQALAELPARFARREDFAEQLRARGLSEPMIAWLSMSLRLLAQEPGAGYRFALPLERVRAMLQSYREIDLWAALELPAAAATHMVIAGRSSTTSAADRQRLAQAAARGGGLHLHTFPHSSHWVHVDAFEALGALLRDERR